MELKFYVCKICGNIITHVRDSGARVVCCGEEMQELTANTTDAATEKHVPVMVREDGEVTVTVGSVPHPMLAAHSIQWICLKTRQGCQIKYLKPGDAPRARFSLCDGDAMEAVYEYCNLHGLWKA